MDFLKATFFVIAVLLMGLCLIFVPSISGTLSLSFVTVLGIYLGTDVASMIATTSRLPDGEYKEIKKHKYVLSGICLSVLIVITLILWEEALQTALTSFLSSCMVVIGCLIGGLEGNKIATKKEVTK
jgi:glucan phosphoethanolaminetransferase (alkaline phosphatase superfamily)